MKAENVMLRCGGGLGRIIAFTGVVRQYARENPTHRIRVMSSYPIVFSQLDFVDRFYPFPQQGIPFPDFYDANKDFDVLDAEPYVSLEYRQGRKHLIEVWCEKLGLQVPEEIRGTVKLSREELLFANSMKMQMNLDKVKLIAFQPFGGTPYSSPDMAFDILRQKQTRDLSVEHAQAIADGLVKRGFAVLQISLNSEPQLKGTMKLPIKPNEVMNPRILFAMIDRCDGLLGIDSFAQHLWAALGKKDAMVVFGGTNPVNLGYKTNRNIVNAGSCKNLHCNRPDTFMFDQIGTGEAWGCPTKKCMEFIPENIVDQFSDLMKEKENGPA